jgi:ATP-dependent Lon protease
MLKDALEDDRLIATALLEPGWENDYEGRPPIASTVCVGRIVSHAREADDRHNILLLGVRRARIRHEWPDSLPYRQAEVRFLADFYGDAAAEPRHRVKRLLVEGFRSYLPKNQTVQEQLDRLLSSQIPLGMLTDIVAFTVNLELRVKQQLLDQLNVDARARTLLDRLATPEQDHQDSDDAFPPEFSDN